MADDLISRQAAIDALDAHCKIVCVYSDKQRAVMCGACPLGTAFDVIEALPSAQPEWISVKDQAPPEGTHCLANIRWSEDDNEVCELDYTFYPNKSAVTHWMPLPEPPKDGE